MAHRRGKGVGSNNGMDKCGSNNRTLKGTDHEKMGARNEAGGARSRPGLQVARGRCGLARDKEADSRVREI